LTNSTDWLTHNETLTLKFKSVCTVASNTFDLKIDILPGYRAIPGWSHVIGNMYAFNMAVGSNATLKFQLLEGDIVADVSKIKSILLSVMDLDMGISSRQWITTTGVDLSVYGAEVLRIKSSSGELKFIGTRQGNDTDNPTKAMDLGPRALQSAVALKYSSTVEWTMTFGIEAGDGNGRFFYLAGATSFTKSLCPATEQITITPTTTHTTPTPKTTTPLKHSFLDDGDHATEESSDLLSGWQ